MLLIIIAVLGYVSLVLGVSSYIAKKQKTTRSLLGGAAALMAGHLWLLGGFTGAIIQALLAVRSFASNFVTSKKQRHILFSTVCICIVAFTVITWSGWKSLIPAVAALNSTYALCYMNNRNMRKLLVVSSSLWLVNGIVWNSLPQMLTEGIKVMLNVYTIVSMTRKGEFTSESALSLQDAKPVEMTKEDWELEREILNRFDANNANDSNINSSKGINILSKAITKTLSVFPTMIPKAASDNSVSTLNNSVSTLDNAMISPDVNGHNDDTHKVNNVNTVNTVNTVTKELHKEI